MLIGVGDAEAQHHFVDEWRIGKFDGTIAEVGAGLKHQFVDTADERVGIENRCIEAAVTIGARFGNEFAIG